MVFVLLRVIVIVIVIGIVRDRDRACVHGRGRAFAGGSAVGVHGRRGFRPRGRLTFFAGAKKDKQRKHLALRWLS